MATGKREDTHINSKWLLLLLLLFTTVFAAVIISTQFFPAAPVLPPDTAPPDTEENAQKLPESNETKNESPAGSGSVNLTYSDRVSINLDTGEASLYFLNPQRSNHDIVLQISIRDTIIAQSDLFPAGYRLETLDLLPDAAARLSEGGYNGIFLVHYYRQDTGEKAAVNTEIPIYVVVRQ